MTAADDIAARGVQSVKMGDREHRYFSPKELRDDAAAAAADLLDDDYAGFFDVELSKPS